MFEYLEYLRTKPRQTRKQIAFVVAMIVSGLIFTSWFSVRFSSTNEDSINLAKAEDPFSVVANTIMGIKEKTDDMASTFDEQLNEVVTSTAEIEESFGDVTNSSPSGSTTVLNVPYIDPYSLPPDTPTDEATTSETTI